MIEYDLVDFGYDSSGDGEFRVYLNGILKEFYLSYDVAGDYDDLYAVIMQVWEVKGENVVDYDLERLPPSLIEKIEGMINDAGFNGRWQENRESALSDYYYEIYRDLEMEE